MAGMTELLSAARGDTPCDLVLKNGRIINTFTLEILESDVGIKDGVIAGTGEYEGIVEMDLGGAYVSPGFIESHFHIESTMLRPPELARLVVPRGTTCIVADPHEIANVAGIAGIEFFLSDSEKIPMDLYLTAPSCVPTTRFETAGARVNARDIKKLYRHRRVIGLGEVMNFPSVVKGASDTMKKIEASRGRPIDGHAPMLSGKNLCAYIAAGPRSDHECTSWQEALEKARLGMWIMVREGAEPGNMRKLVSIINEKNCGRFMLTSDDKPPDKLFNEGHMDFLLREAVRMGLESALSVRLVTLNPSQYFGFSSTGAVAPGYQADLVVFNDLKTFEVKKVFKSGQLVAENGSLTAETSHAIPRPSILDTVHLPKLNEDDLYIEFKKEKPRARVMEIIRGTILTGNRIEDVPVDKNGRFLFDPDNDLASVFVLERHTGSGRIGKGLVRGFGLKKGALASSLSHDSHNIVCVSSDSLSAFTAISCLASCGGGLCAAVGDRCAGLVELGICGLIHEKSYESLLESLGNLTKAVNDTGCEQSHPFFYLSFISLPVVPELKITDMGLFDVNAFGLVELEVGEGEFKV
jgi:adenine deaminase